MAGDDSSARHDSHACARAWHILRSAHNAVEERLAATLAGECDLAIHEFDALLHLRLNQQADVRMQDLLKPVPLSQPALSRLVARLVERDLVTRSPGTDDGRVILLRLTDSGSALIDKAIAVHARAIHDTLIGRMSREEQDLLLETLDRIARASG